ncbi:hypothetical protein [Allorhizocola rhizosphaerae]|uniref:hypothetical protein n=1 Tax=Allorhizocola rhizosphaerae TaxID=1872709 RepID=UPI000E3C0122|nr:hypothetical protein [Allorhizocola rhizosphaerae]
MGEAIDRAAAIVQRAAGNTVAPGVAALMTAAAAVTGNPSLAIWAVPVSALAGSATEEAVAFVKGLWAAEGVQRFAEAVEEDSGSTAPELLEREGVGRKGRHLLGEAVEASSTTSDDWKVRVLARAFIVGAKDHTKIDEMRLLVKLVDDLEGVDARCLAAAVRCKEVFLTRELLEFDRQLEAVAAILLSKLVRLGFLDVVDERHAILNLTPYEQEELHDARQTAGRAEPRVPTGFTLSPVGRATADLLASIGQVEHHSNTIPNPPQKPA